MNTLCGYKEENMDNAKYQININMSKNSHGAYDWMVSKYENMIGYFKVKEGLSNTTDQAWEDAKKYVNKHSCTDES
jgi:hypothetical protein